MRFSMSPTLLGSSSYSFSSAMALASSTVCVTPTNARHGTREREWHDAQTSR